MTLTYSTLNVFGGYYNITAAGAVDREFVYIEMRGFFWLWILDLGSRFWLDPGSGIPGRAQKINFLIKILLKNQFFGLDPGSGIPGPAPEPAKSKKTIILSEIWIFGCAKVLNCQRFPKKVSVSLEFWTPHERIA